jgi:hypothetical protein
MYCLLSKISSIYLIYIHIEIVNMDYDKDKCYVYFASPSGATAAVLHLNGTLYVHTYFPSLLHLYMYVYIYIMSKCFYRTHITYTSYCVQAPVSTVRPSVLAYSITKRLEYFLLHQRLLLQPPPVPLLLLITTLVRHFFMGAQ